MTGIAGHLTRVLASLTLTTMLMLDRDRQIVMSVGRFRQLSTAHVFAMHFQGAKSTTRLKSALKRLVESKYLSRLERRPVGGRGAGSGQYVYQLGREGWKLYGHEQKFWTYRAIDHHTIAIADAYVELLDLEHEGRIEIIQANTEPESWMTVGGVQLRPDLFVEVQDIARGRRGKMWLEIDMGTERQAKIREKLAAYWNAYQNVEGMESFPRVVFLAPDATRARELRWIIEDGPKRAQDLFLVSTISEYGRLIFS